MSDTFNEFVKFISEDPLMLGLCAAIIILIIVFLFVLIFGGKKKDKKEESKVEENTTQLLATDINDEPLKSTQEFNLSNMDIPEENLEKTINVPEVESIGDNLAEQNAPISIDEAINLKTSREENELKNTIQIPVVEETPGVELEIPNAPIMPELDNPVQQTEPVILSNEPELELELPTMTSELPKVPVNEIPSATQPFSSVYVNSGDELPKANEEASNTEIIKHIPVEETPKIEVPETNVMDDLDLPKLNVSDETSVLSSLTGETFNINKD